MQIFQTFAKQSQICTDRIEDSCGACGRGLCDFSWLGTNSESSNDGFGLVLEKDFNRMWRVVEIKPNSPADTDDIQLNDLVLSVNSRPMKVIKNSLFRIVACLTSIHAAGPQRMGHQAVLRKRGHAASSTRSKLLTAHPTPSTGAPLERSNKRQSKWPMPSRGRWLVRLRSATTALHPSPSVH